MNQDENALHVTTNLKISSGIDARYLQDEHSLDEHFEVNGKILNESNFMCINCGPQVSVLTKKNGSRYSFWSANQTTRDTITKITCMVEVSLGSSVPLIAAGSEEGLLCFYYTGVSRLLRAVQFSHKIVSLTLLDNGDRSEIGNWICLPEELQLMNGVLAVGLDGGAVYLVDICRHLLEKCIVEGGPVTIEFPSQLLLINLRTDTSNDIKAKKAHTNSYSGETLAIFLNENSLEQFKKVITSNLIHPVQKRNGDHSVEEFHLVVTGLEYFKEIACLAVGFNSGCFQLWQLSLFRTIFVSPLMDAQIMPIVGFCLQEPTDDPHSVCFIWATHQSSANNACRPFAAMYMASFNSKKLIDGYGCFYESYKGCQTRYELALGEDIDNVIDGRIISCRSISRVVQRRHPQWPMQSNEDESIVNVCAIAWEVWTPDRTNVTSKLTLFDINQWYRAQMPWSLNAGGSNSYVTNLLLPASNDAYSDPLLDVYISEKSLSQFSAYQPLDEHYFPLSLSFDCTCLYEHKKLECVWQGIQHELINGLDSAGPSALLDPSRFFNRFLSVGLKPSFYEAPDIASLSVVAERQMLLTVMLEQGHVSFIKDCVRMWADGCLAVANCTLPTLLRWGWSAVTFYKQMADNICIQLFDHRNTPTMKELVYVVSLLHKMSDIFDYILKNFRNCILEGNVELQSISLQLFIQYLDSVVWSTENKLLPEMNEIPSDTTDAVQYPQSTLQNKILERREVLRKLSRKLLDVTPQLYNTDLLLVDVLLKETPGGKRIISQWEAEGSLVGGLYPPPSIQSILRVFLVRGVPTQFKHMLIYYFLLDIEDLLHDDNPYTAKMLQNFTVNFKLTKSQTLITKAFWLIDNGKLKEAVNCLTDKEVSKNDVSELHNKILMYSLFVQNEPHLALTYFRAFKPLLSELEDAKFHLLILLECGHILQAFDFQRKYKHWQSELLDLFFTGCMRRKELGVVYKLCLDNTEEEAFTQFLESNRHPHSEDLRVIYLLTRARYVEAIDVNNKLSVKRAQGVGPPAFERRTPLSAFKKSTQKPKAEEARDQMRETIVSAFSKALPPITRELADFCSRQKTTLGSWKQVDRPEPLSVSVHKQPSHAISKERFVELAMATTRQTWAPLLATPQALKSRLRSNVEDTPFLRSTSFSSRSRATPKPSDPNQSLLMSASKYSAKRGLGCDEVDEASLLMSESRSKRARLEPEPFETAEKKKKENEADAAALLLSTPFIKRKRVAELPCDVTPRTPLSILKSPWKSGQSSLSRHSERSDIPSFPSPMPRQIRFCDDLEKERSISFDIGSSPSRTGGEIGGNDQDVEDRASIEECIEEMSETDEDINRTSSPLTISDGESIENNLSIIHIPNKLDKSQSRHINKSDDGKIGEDEEMENVSSKPVNTVTDPIVESTIEKEQEPTSQDEECSIVDIPSSDSKFESSSPDRIPSSPSYHSTFNEEEKFYDYNNDDVGEQKTYENLSSASVFVNVSGVIDNSVYELEEGEIAGTECGSVGISEDAVIAKKVVYENVDEQSEADAEPNRDEDGSNVDIYAGMDDAGEKEANYEPGFDVEDDFYKGSPDYNIENYEDKEELNEEQEDDHRDDEGENVICLDDSSNSDQASREELVTVVPKHNRFSSDEEELDYDESRMYGDNDENMGEAGEQSDEFEDEIENEEEEEEEEYEGEEDEDEEMIEDEEEFDEDFENVSTSNDGSDRDREEEGNDDSADSKLETAVSKKEVSAEVSKKDSLNERESSKGFINSFWGKKGESSKNSGQPNINADVNEIQEEAENMEEDKNSKLEKSNEDEQDICKIDEVFTDMGQTSENVDNIGVVIEEAKCEKDDTENLELKIVEVSGSASVFHEVKDTETKIESHDESFGKLEIEEEKEEVMESGNNLDESKLDTIEEESEENRTELSTKVAESIETSEVIIENTESKDASKLVNESCLASPGRLRQNRKSSSEVPSTTDLKLRRSMRKSSSANRLTSAPDLLQDQDKNMSSDIFESSPTVHFDNKNTRSRRSTSVTQSPSRVTSRSLRKSTSATSLHLDESKIQAHSSSSTVGVFNMQRSSKKKSLSKESLSEEQIKLHKTAHVVSSKHRLEDLSETKCLVDETIEVEDVETTLKNPGNVLDAQEKTDLESSNNEKDSIVAVQVDDKVNLSETKCLVEETMEVEDVETTLKKPGNVLDGQEKTDLDSSYNEKNSIVAVQVVDKVDQTVENVDASESTLCDNPDVKVEKINKIKEAVDSCRMAGQVTTASVANSIGSEREMKRTTSYSASEAPESVYNETEELVQKPIPRRAASVSNLDDESLKLNRSRRSSRRYRSGMIWSEYLKNVDTYSKILPDSSCASSVSSALDCADDVSTASISTATTATGTSKKLRYSRFMDRSFLKAATKSYDIILSDDEDTTKSAVVTNQKQNTLTSSIISVIGSVQTVTEAEEVSPIKEENLDTNEPSEKELETQPEESSLNNTKKEQVRGKRKIKEAENASSDTSTLRKTRIQKKTEETKTVKSTRGKKSTKSSVGSNNSSSDLVLTELKNKVSSEKKDSAVGSDGKILNIDESLSEIETSIVPKTRRRSKSITNLSSKSSQSSSTRLRSSRTRSESPMGLSKSKKSSSTVDGDLFGDNSPDTTLSQALSQRNLFKRELRRSKLLDRPPSRNILEVIPSEDEEEEEEEEEAEKEEKKESEDEKDVHVDDKLADETMSLRNVRRKRGKKGISSPADEENVKTDKRGKGKNTPVKGKRAQSKTAVLSDVETPPTTPKRNRRSLSVQLDSDASPGPASSSLKGKKTVQQKESASKRKSLLRTSSTESLVSNPSASIGPKKRKRLSQNALASSTPEKTAPDLSIIDSSLVDYTASRRVTRHQLANMQRFPIRRRELDESVIEETVDSEDDVSVLDSSVSSVMSTRSSARLRMKSSKK